MGVRSSSYPLMKQEFVTGDDSVTFASVAAKYGRGKSTVTRMANIEDWKAARLAYREKQGNASTGLILHNHAEKAVEITNKLIEATEKSLDKLIEGIDSGEVKVYPSDVVKLVTAVQVATTPKTAAAPGEGPEGTGGIHISKESATELAGMVERLARDQLDKRSAPAAPRLVSEGSG